MLRSIDEKGGIGIYTQNITRELLDLDSINEYVLFYRNPSYLGYFADYRNVNEYLIEAPSKIIWDQLQIPLACKQKKVDVLFHPKFSIPILSTCKTVMVLHGAGWFIPEFQGFWSKSDIIYARVSMPVYIMKASAVISVSEQTTNTFNRIFNLPPEKIRTIYFAPARIFKRITDSSVIDIVRKKYSLPKSFIFSLSGYKRGTRKNFSGILTAYQMYYGTTPHSLVVAGTDCNKFREDYQIPDIGYGSEIYFPGWIDQEDLPAVYSMADVFLYPSNVEAFPIPITEALACGTPIITSSANGLLEIAGDSAIYVKPNDHDGIVHALIQVLSNAELRESLSEKGMQRAKTFSWDKCSRQTLEILTNTVIKK